MRHQPSTHGECGALVQQRATDWKLAARKVLQHPPRLMRGIRNPAAHLVIGRSGASTVSELAAIGRPSILVPLPGALDQDQFANAGVLAAAGGAIRLHQDDFTPAHLAAEITSLTAGSERLTAMAQAARSQGAP